MTHTFRPLTACSAPVDTDEPHFGDLRKFAFLRRLTAYRAKTNVNAQASSHEHAETCLGGKPIIT